MHNDPQVAMYTLRPCPRYFEQFSADDSTGHPSRLERHLDQVHSVGPAMVRAVVLGVALLEGCGRIGYEPETRMVPVRGEDAAMAEVREQDASASVALDDAEGPPSSIPDGPTMCAASMSTDFCTSVPALARPPVIDGVVDCGLSLQSVGTLWSGPLPAPTDHAAEYAVAWRPDGLYMFVRVTGPGRRPAPPNAGAFCGDSVELFVHRNGMPIMPPRYDDPGTGQFVIAAPTDDSMVSRRAELYVMAARPWSSPRFGAFPVPGGYTVEAFFTAADLRLPTWSLEPGGTIGLNVAVNISWADGRQGTCGYHQGQFVLHRTGPGCPGMPACDVGAFCTARLAP